MQGTLFGYSEAQIAEFGSTVGIAALMLFMLFIIGNLAYRSNAGKVGTFALYLVLAFGMVGFIAKIVIQSVWNM